MFVIFYNKQTTEIKGFRHDLSTNPMTADEAFTDYCIGHNETEVTMNFVELPYQNLQFYEGKYLYNKVTNRIEPNPNFVPPPEPPQEST